MKLDDDEIYRMLVVKCILYLHCFFFWKALVNSKGVAVCIETTQASSSPAYAQCVTSLSIGSDSVASFLVGRCRSKSVSRRRAQLWISSQCTRQVSMGSAHHKWRPTSKRHLLIWGRGAIILIWVSIRAVIISIERTRAQQRGWLSKFH